MNGALVRVWDSDIAWSFRHSPVAIGAAVVAAIMVFSAVFAAWVAPHNPFDLATLNLLDASLPPAWEEGGQPKFLLGTDDQGRDVFSAILFGMQISRSASSRCCCRSCSVSGWGCCRVMSAAGSTPSSCGCAT
jgi:peptide/nickel transport system permease protein